MAKFWKDKKIKAAFEHKYSKAALDLAIKPPEKITGSELKKITQSVIEKMTKTHIDIIKEMALCSALLGYSAFYITHDCPTVQINDIHITTPEIFDSVKKGLAVIELKMSLYVDNRQIGDEPVSQFIFVSW